MKNIVLTGFMGTGKTEVGRELARMLSMKLIDIDAEIELARGMKINDIFRDLGEPAFRDIETEMIRAITKGRNLIISAGGGAVLREENMQALRENGIVFCLTAGPDTILQRTSQHDDRPLLKVDDPRKRIKELLELRRPFYEKAGIMIDTEEKNPFEIAGEIREIYHAETQG
ncbi:MAG: shikimate kinase [Nitrospirae bacterium]|nr:MAG: shikimate kinase [Nitrospirota bacterium]